jgi:hypothetical protein
VSASPHFLYLIRALGDDPAVTQRAHPRYAIELDAVLAIEGLAQAIHGRTQDISAGGFCVHAPLDGPSVAPGSPCTIKLALVFSETEFSEQLSLRGTVAWSTRLKHGVQIGVKFDAIDAQARQYLDLFINFLEEGREDPEAGRPAQKNTPDPGEP